MFFSIVLIVLVICSVILIFLICCIILIMTCHITAYTIVYLLLVPLVTYVVVNTISSCQSAIVN